MLIYIVNEKLTFQNNSDSNNFEMYPNKTEYISGSHIFGCSNIVIEVFEIECIKQ